MSQGLSSCPSLRGVPRSGTTKQTPRSKEIASSLTSFAPRNDALTNIYSILYRHFGPRHWWPADTKFEVIIGAILTQNTAWVNVERAIENLKKEHLLSPKKLYNLDNKKLAELIRPSGYYNIKAKRVKAFLKFLFEYHNGSLKKLFANNLPDLRDQLLTVNGIGPETADSIILYAAGKPTFVVDAYTKRIFSRQGLISVSATYEETKKFFADNLPRSAKLFNEYHVLIVELGKNICKTKPECDVCPINASLRGVPTKSARRSKLRFKCGDCFAPRCARGSQ